MLLSYLNYLPADVTHDVAHMVLRLRLPMVGIRYVNPVELGPLKLMNPLGLGAGLDKDGYLAKTIARLGLGFITVGSVTLRPRSGNPRPRVVKYPQFKAMANSMGLPSRGIADLSTRLSGIVDHLHRLGVALIVNVAGFTEGEFVEAMHILNRFNIDGVEINISSPTYRGYWFTDTDRLLTLMREVSSASRRMTLIKLPLGLDPSTYRVIVAEANRLGLGLTIANTLPIKEPRLSTGYGGLSGLPIYPLVKALIAKARSWGFENPIIGLGGVFNGRQALELLKVGANAVSIVTAFAYEGPLAVVRILRELKVGWGGPNDT